MKVYGKSELGMHSERPDPGRQITDTKHVAVVFKLVI